MEIRCTECGGVITRQNEYYEMTEAEQKFTAMIDPFYDTLPEFDFKRWRMERHDFIKDAHMELIDAHRKKQEQIYDLEKDTKKRIEVIEAVKKEMSAKFYKRLVDDYESWRKAK